MAGARKNPWAYSRESQSNSVQSKVWNNFKSLAEAALFSEEMKGTFPLTNRAHRLLLTAPVTVAKDEGVFSRLKLIKTHLRTTMTEKRLEALMMLSCEKDLTYNADLDKIAESWAVLKSRKVKLQ